MIECVIQGDPVPQARSRFRRMGKFIMTYDPQAEKKKLMKSVLSLQCKKLNVVLNHDNSYKVNVTFFMPIPQALRKKSIYVYGIKNPISKPDIDNLAKFILDCGNGILWSDDKQIIELNLRKRYSLNPRTQIKVMEIQQTKLPLIQEKILSVFTHSEFEELADDLMNLHVFIYDFLDSDDKEVPLDHLQNSFTRLIQRYFVKLQKIQKLLPVEEK